jgi:hypothetical protein
MDIEHHFILYGVILVLAGVWAEYRYKCGVKLGNSLAIMDKNFEKDFKSLFLKSEVAGAGSMIRLLQDKKVIRMDPVTGVVYGIADSSYDVKDDLHKLNDKT